MDEYLNDCLNDSFPEINMLAIQSFNHAAVLSFGHSNYHKIYFSNISSF